MWLLWLIIGLVGGFICGALVWRNNAKKSAEVYAIVTDKSMSTEDKLKAIASFLKKGLRWSQGSVSSQLEQCIS